MRQPDEQTDEIFIVVVDETYGGDEENWEEESNQYKNHLETQFSSTFFEANVGPGADIPAFITIIATASVPLWSLLLTTFFLGKPINENLESWKEIGTKMKSFFARPTILARNGASVIAINQILEDLGELPKEIKLLSYRIHVVGDDEDLSKIERSNTISENVPTLYLGYTRHIFEIEANSIQYRVSVEGKDCHLLRL